MLQVADESMVEALLTENDQEYQRRLAHLAFGGMWGFVAQHETRVVAVVDEVLGRDNPFVVYRKMEPIQEFSGVLSIRRYWLVFRESSPSSLTRIWDRYRMMDEAIDREEEMDAEKCDILLRCQALVDTSKELADSWSTDVWASDLGPWTTLVERGRELFGDRWAF